MLLEPNHSNQRNINPMYNKFIIILVLSSPQCFQTLSNWVNEFFNLLTRLFKSFKHNYNKKLLLLLLFSKNLCKRLVCLFVYNATYVKNPVDRSDQRNWFFCHKLNFSNPYIFATWMCKLFIFWIKTFWFNSIQSLKY